MSSSTTKGAVSTSTIGVGGVLAGGVDFAGPSEVTNIQAAGGVCSGLSLSSGGFHKDETNETWRNAGSSFPISLLCNGISGSTDT